MVVMFGFVSMTFSQDAQKPLPDDPEMLSLIENECILNMQLIDSKLDRMNVDAAILKAQRMQWE